MKVHIKTVGKGFEMQAHSEDGNNFILDASPEIGGKGKGIRPMEAILSALGACCVIDVILILKKQKQVLNSLEVAIEGTREKIENYSLFRNICLHFYIKGDVTKGKAERAIQLSLTKYCSVAKTLEANTTITYKISLN